MYDTKEMQIIINNCVDIVELIYIDSWLQLYRKDFSLVDISKIIQMLKRRNRVIQSK